jgi:hypothetical protein
MNADPKLKQRLAISLRAALVGIALPSALLVWERHRVVERQTLRHVLEREGLAEFSSSALAAQELGVTPGDPALARVNWLRRLCGDEAIDNITVLKPSDEAERALRWFPEARRGRIGLDPFLTPQQLPAAATAHPPASSAPSGEPDFSSVPPLPSLPISHERFID